MKKFIMGSILLISLSLYGQDNGIIYTPFGAPDVQPPSVDTVNIVDAKIGYSAGQTCGFTNWSEINIHLPKQLLSKKYWKKVGKDLVDKATQSVMALSGALPSMIACNVSPTFCNIFQQSELMASMESSITFDSCEMLDSINPASNYSKSVFSDCMKQLQENSPEGPLTHREARERCANGNGESSSKGQQINEALANAKPRGMSVKEILEYVFPGKVRSAAGGIVSTYRGNNNHSSRLYIIDELDKTAFGVTLNNRISVKQTGMAYDGIMDIVNSESEELKGEIERILLEMRKLQLRGFSPYEIIERSKKHWHYSKRPKPLSPFYRRKLVGDHPELIVSPEEIYNLLRITTGDTPDFKRGPVRNAINLLATAGTLNKKHKTYLVANEMILGKCKSDPKLQDPETRSNCESLISSTESKIKIIRDNHELLTRSMQLKEKLNEYIANIEKSNEILTEAIYEIPTNLKRRDEIPTVLK